MRFQYFYVKNKCSISIFIPIDIRISPPKICAFFSNLFPNLLPITTPIAEIKNVITPISSIDMRILVFKNAKVIPNG